MLLVRQVAHDVPIVFNKEAQIGDSQLLTSCFTNIWITEFWI